MTNNTNRKPKFSKTEIISFIIVLITFAIFFKKEILELLSHTDVIRILFLGLWISVVIGNILTRIVVRYLKASIAEPKEYMGKFAIILGPIESFAYTLAWVLGYPVFIAFWLGIKTAGRWPTTREDHQYKGEINSFLIGNLLTLCFSVFAGELIKYYLFK